MVRHLLTFVSLAIITSVLAQHPDLTRRPSPLPTAHSPPPDLPLGPLAALRTIYNAFVHGTLPVDPAIRDAEDAAAGITRLTDSDYRDVLSSADDRDVWVILIHGGPHDAITRMYLDTQANATALVAANASIGTGTVPDTSSAYDLAGLTDEVASDDDGDDNGNGAPRFHFARVDYLTEISLCTRWLVIRAPFIVIASDRGRTLRFLEPPRLPPSGEYLHALLLSGVWKDIKPWISKFAPGREYAFIVETYISAQAEWTRLSSRIPNWVWLMLTAGIGQRIIQWFHSGESGRERERERERDAQYQRAARERARLREEAELKRKHAVTVTAAPAKERPERLRKR